MAFAQGSRSSLSYIVESTFGTTPAGNFTNLPFSTHSLNLTKDRVAGNDIQADRMPRVDRHGNRQVGGDIAVDLRKGDYDVFLESAMLSAWSTDVLKVGTTPKFISIQDYAADIDLARRFTGCSVSTMGVSLAPNQMVTTSFGIVGKNMNPTITAGSFIIGDSYTIVTAGTTDFTAIGSANDTVGTTFTASGVGSGTGTASLGFAIQRTETAASGNAPFDAYSGDLAIGNVGSSSAVAIVTALDFTLDNAFAPTFVIGDDSAPSLEYGRATVEGTLSAYFEDESLINRFLNETETEIEVSIDDPTGANPYTFLFPRVKINSADVGVDGPTARMISMSFVALYDTTEATNLKITRTS
jgi:hypothetical protein